MTREEAIKFGNMWLETFGDAKDSNTYNFFKISIKALEQEPILDKIRAEIEQARYGLVNDGLDIALNIIDKYKAETR